MSMSTHVVGFVPPDQQWQRMYDVYQTCRAAHVDVPEVVEKFFNYVPPDVQGVRFSEDDLRKCAAVIDWKNKDSNGFEVVIAKLPPNVKILRFYNSW